MNDFPIYDIVSKQSSNTPMNVKKRKKLVEDISEMDSSVHELIYVLIQHHYNKHNKKDSSKPVKTSSLKTLVPQKNNNIVSTLSKNNKDEYNFSIVDFQNYGNKYRCEWDRNIIPSNVQPIGCPIRYVPNKVTKTYLSELSNDIYSISEYVDKKISDRIMSYDDKKYFIHKNDYYETVGVFCSFNCCMAFIEDPSQKRQTIFRHSKTLLIQMYNEVTNDKICEIIPAPHWRLLKENGGHMTFEEFQSKFNKYKYTSQGIIASKSIGYLFKDELIFM